MNVPMVAEFNLGGGEIILGLALVLILFGATHLGNIARGLGQGIIEFRKASRRLAEDIDQDAIDAGRSVGGIYGGPAAQALTPHNQVAELYDPAVFSEAEEHPNKSFRSVLATSLNRMTSRILRRILSVVQKWIS